MGTSPSPAPVSPAITGVSPTTGAAGTSVTITGLGFTGATAVQFGGTDATQMNVASDTQITATSPTGGTGAVDITVTTPAGTSASTAADKFSFIAAAALPRVTQVSPSSATDGTAVVITGSGFTGATAVKFGSLSATGVVVASDTQIKAVVPAGGTGTADVTVTTPAGTSTASAADQFTYTTTSTPAMTGAAASGSDTVQPSPPPPPMTTTAGPAPGVNSQGYYVDPGLSSQLVGSIVDILKTASSPDALEAQNMILRRIAMQGDVVGSRIPPPRNISEIGGYINLLSSLKQPEMRSQMLAGILGVAGPSQPLGWVSNTQPLSFITLPNDRPGGSAQAAITLTFMVRSDFNGPVQAAINALHQRGCALPFAGRPAVTLPPAMPGVLPPTDVMPYLGRTLDLAVAAALVDPSTDALVLIRAQGSGDPFQIAARVLVPGAVPVAAGIFDALQCNLTFCSVVQVSGQYVPLRPFLAAAGFYPANPLPPPVSITSTDWARFTNITGLVPGVTKLGDELSLLYNWSTINHSVFAGVLQWVWNGTSFA